MKDTWTKPKVGRNEGGRWGCMAWGSGRGKWRQLYLKNNKKEKNKILKVDNLIFQYNSWLMAAFI